ncbi:MAG TPA: nuclear transport factor 2 family protein [Usitatibacter sp.]|nr:nuclear transport factor 2 family protein [Usitatibacter sp.]
MKTPRTRPRARLYPTPEDAESAFYDALERGDLAAMMAVWAEADDVVCVHPQGPRLVGFDAVRQSWAQIFAGAAQLRVETSGVQRFDGPTVAVHSLVETIGTASGGASGSVHATNVYELTEGGWRMVIHHASPIAEPAAPEEPPEPTHTLH